MNIPATICLLRYAHQANRNEPTSRSEAEIDYWLAHLLQQDISSSNLYIAATLARTTNNMSLEAFALQRLREQHLIDYEFIIEHYKNIDAVEASTRMLETDKDKNRDELNCEIADKRGIPVASIMI